MRQDVSTIKVKEICGSHCVGVEDGLKLFQKIIEIIESGRKVCLDFEGVITITSSFLNYSIGKTFGYFKRTSIENLIQWKGVDDSDNQLINIVIMNAKEYLAKTKDGLKNTNDVIKRSIIEENGEF